MIKAKTGRTFEQRFNVALSRARDRMYLFRSVEEQDLDNPRDLRLKVIRHFRDPMPKEQRPASELIDLCESEFERDVFRRLVHLGYCVTPQVGVGSWRIDLVVEGENDQRLAVELDGSQHIETWLEDLRRQRAMERMGWRFWRCWASSFRRDPDGCMADLVSALTARHIEPIGREARKNIYSEHRAVEVTEPRTSDSELASPLAEPVVEIGDGVVVSYEDGPVHQATLVVAAAQHDPSMGVFKSSSPAGVALLGAGIDDEVTISVGDTSRQATILAIDKEKIPRGSNETPTAPEPMVVERGPSRAIVEGFRPQPSVAPKADHRAPETSRTASSRSRRQPEQGGTAGNPILEELQALDARFENPRCSQCDSAAHFAINDEGPVVACANGECKKVERADVQTLQRLAERLGVTCYQCKLTNLESKSGKFSNYLKCRNDGANNSWQAVSDRLRRG